GKAESVLILEPINNDLRGDLAPKFAKVMQIDNYSARMILSSKSWRLYRTGKLGEINFYVEELTKVEIPCFALTIDEIKAINVYKVNYFQVLDQQITVVCTDESSHIGTLTFDLTEITQRVEGLLPIFEDVVDLDWRRKLQRKTKTLDYAKICDLHLPQRNSILRMCDYLYDFQEGIRLGESNRYSWEHTTLTSWQNLMKLFEEKLDNQTVWRDFTNFAELALDSMEMLQHFESHIDLFRKEDTLWDQAFQLYSGLVFLRQ
ncbi:MAG TPA: tetratricopeptide repeat protein, partial [Allocoleopsis sp.]